ncbi:hypothetical protein [Sporosarcina sp. Marseille-Q4943]|uniref:hypothetical protein n=1 Tax=Sporosarcina sp. Marseille-Q4943 TaxID=2942204 RepID=UPI00208DDB7E|nr:hypothetical protein [Sporosarcina sp. Marseille-Q4943]
MRRVLSVLLGLFGCAMAIGLSIFALIAGESTGMFVATETGKISILYSGLALIGFMIIKSKPKLGGWLMIIGGIVIFGQFKEQNLGLIATIPLLLSAIIGMTVKSKKRVIVKS